MSCARTIAELIEKYIAVDGKMLRRSHDCQVTNRSTAKIRNTHGQKN